MHATRAHRAPGDRRLRARATFVALALCVVAVLSAHVARLGHLVFVAHVRCEHGALVHPGSAHVAAAPTRAVPRASAGPHVEAAGAAEEHDHCDGLATVPALVASPVAPVPAALLAWSSEVAVVRARLVARPIAQLSLAPKGSPPA